MIDMHYDLLSIMYYCYKKNDFTYVENWIKNFTDDNVCGLLANLYFMNEDEMKDDLGKYYDPNVSVLEMFKIAVEVFKKYLPHTKVIFSIEGCDYIKDTKELEELYKLGLRNILLVWNNPNKYGSGNRSSSGLTDEGRKFLIKAIDLGISIDLSHMNRKTFSDTVDLLKEQKKLQKDVKVIVSHSNCYDIWNHPRNLTDDQLKSIKDLDPVVGLVSYGPFVASEKEDLDKKRAIYLEHINRVISILGINHVGVATDDMTFSLDLLGKHEDIEQLFNYKNVKEDLTKLLSRKYNKEEIEKILYYNIFNKLF